jgi:hypothetical protein
VERRNRTSEEVVVPTELRKGCTLLVTSQKSVRRLR